MLLTPKANRKKQRHLKHMRMRRSWQMYLFLLLPLIYLLVFKYEPMLGAQIAFRQYAPRMGIWGSKWVGFAQFTKFFQSYQFERVLTNTLSLSLYSLLAGFPLPILAALCINALRSNRYRSIIQNVTYMPHFISTVVMVGMLMQVFNSRIGIYGVGYRLLTGLQDVPDLLAKPGVFPHLYVWSGIWQSTGWGTIIYVAALSAVDPELHEAAVIDGASRFARLRHVDFPAILPTVTIMLILRCGQIMGIGFDKVYLMQNKLNLSASEVIATYVYKVGLAQGTNDFSYATAIGLFNSVVNMIMLVLVNGISRRASESSLW
jgi:ABC-type polysaccharide transport system, permease component